MMAFYRLAFYVRIAVVFLVSSSILGENMQNEERCQICNAFHDLGLATSGTCPPGSYWAGDCKLNDADSEEAARWTMYWSRTILMEIASRNSCTPYHEEFRFQSQIW
eukprot:TRINITY_DN58065_c0_g1_i1.p1 TRINITY_DN58065_c0_g1~~TRINITY_DN58065_c0_g1_i1.p1  ORF type:complete len:107 (+),score=15.73 TRINITY_DN58065_c0_g1_i1:56-376(+)